VKLKLILEIYEKEPHIFTYINTKGKKELDNLMQQTIYIPSCEKYEILQKKIINMRKCKDIKELLQQNYFISNIKEYPHYYYNVTDKDIYQITWRKQRYDKVDISIGTTLYHLARKSTLNMILKEGLRPSKFSTDAKFYGCNKIFFITKPILSENEECIDGHLYNRIQLEIIYDGSYELYRDFEYSHRNINPMVYCITDNNIKINKVSNIQPERKYKEKLV